MDKEYYQLPPRIGESEQSRHEAPRRMVVLGANGAGKSRFAHRLADDMEPARVFELSALKALFDRDATSGREASVDVQYAKAVEAGMPTRQRPNELERVMALMMRREMQSLLTYKVRHASDASATLPDTQLDSVIAMWQELFPDSRIMVADGEMLFAGSQEDDDGAYAATKLSTGERAVLYYLAAVTFAPLNATVIVDSPESFLHPSIMRGVWARVEQLRPDCRMVYVTNSLEFAT
ncbi:MAG: ATP-binding protein, partial [Muribaculaceae bacterium]|nr:ATP-binding protein [Muribaculaceae bacterium]